MKLFATYIGIT